MSMQDPIADMFTRIRNAQQAKHENVELLSSIMKEEIAKVLKEEGYIANYSVEALENNSKSMSIELKYFKGRPVISKIKRVSRPGLRIYKTVKELKPVPGFGILIVSTPKGVMSHAAAKAQNVGGEIIGEVA
ncbi:MAG: 30S ribosomal protein S8 [Legionellales bacterium RIFCSPHIGHO2_12_FULL_35_11]|nr:MAG: 30S ribosomal protein S8 [Legionellales bacterium RIFCSPHIGHO2_12_FULL_35_11]